MKNNTARKITSLVAALTLTVGSAALVTANAEETPAAEAQQPAAVEQVAEQENEAAVLDEILNAVNEALQEAEAAAPAAAEEAAVPAEAAEEPSVLDEIAKALDEIDWDAVAEWEALEPLTMTLDELNFNVNNAAHTVTYFVRYNAESESIAAEYSIAPAGEEVEKLEVTVNEEGRRHEICVRVPLLDVELRIKADAENITDETLNRVNKTMLEEMVESICRKLFD